MLHLRSLASRCAALFRRREWEDRVAEEIQFCLNMQTEENIRRGLEPPEAHAVASRMLGNKTQIAEEVYLVNTITILEETARNIRFSIRTLRKSWGFSFGLVAVLALTLGANIAIFSVVNTVLLHPLAYPNSERLISVETLWTNTGRISQDVSGPDFLDWQAQTSAFEKMAVTQGGDDFATIVGDHAMFANPRYVSADFFEVFGQTSFAGRLLSKQDIPVGETESSVTVVGHHWAEAQFGSAAAAIGKEIKVYGAALRIVGVAVPGFRYPGSADLWVPSNTASGGTNRAQHYYQAVGKLKPDVGLAQAQVELRTIAGNLARQYPENRVKTVSLIPLQELLTGNLKTTLWVLMSAVSVVWLIGCANIANLLLARATGRTREIALRTALGASRVRVAMQLLTESSLLAAVAGVGGLFFAYALIQGVVAWSPANLPRIDEVRIDKSVLIFAFGLSLLSTVFFGLVPALQGSRLDPMDSLKQGGTKSTVSRSGSRLRSTLIVTEVALSVILLVTAGLLMQSFRALQRVDLGFTTDRVLVAKTEYVVRNDDPIEIRARNDLYLDLLDRLRAVPGVSAAAGVSYLPMGREPRVARDFFIQGRPDGKPGERLQAELHAITPGYFKTLEIPLRIGRDFDRTDLPQRAQVAIVNNTLARSAFRGESPIGRHIRINSKAPWMEIVGVAGDTRWQDPSRLPPAVLFVSSTQGWGKSPSIIARTSARSSLDEKALAGTIRKLLHEASPTLPVKFEAMEEMYDSTLAYPRFRTQVITLFAAVAALLAAVGIFSVQAYLVGQRTKELAVRRALGARPADVIQLIVGQGLRLIGIGLLLGLVGALAVARLLTTLLFEISPWDAGTYLAAIAVLGGAALLATLIPAIRATTIAPVIALRQD